MCSTCDGSGYLMQDIGTATIPDFVEIRCACNPEPTDEDASDWDDVPGTAWDDFHHFNDHKYEGI